MASTFTPPPQFHGQVSEKACGYAAPLWGFTILIPLPGNFLQVRAVMEVCFHSIVRGRPVLSRPRAGQPGTGLLISSPSGWGFQGRREASGRAEAALLGLRERLPSPRARSHPARGHTLPLCGRNAADWLSLRAKMTRKLPEEGLVGCRGHGGHSCPIGLRQKAQQAQPGWNIRCPFLTLARGWNRGGGSKVSLRAEQQPLALLWLLGSFSKQLYPLTPGRCSSDTNATNSAPPPPAPSAGIQSPPG